MTHHTDAERAEFDLMRFAFESKGSEAYKAWLIEVRDGDSYKPWDVVNDWRNWQTAWQAARRAPAAPVQMPQPVAMLSVGKSGIAMHLHTARPLDRFDSGNHDLLLASEVRAMLAAAPQPPEAGCSVSNGETQAAPVQLPEPDSYCFQHEETGLTEYVDAQQVEWGFEKNNPRWKRVGAAYSEQQVRQLLADQQFKLDELAMLTRMVVHAFRQVAPDNKTAAKAVDYLKRKGLVGNPLRAAQEQST